MVFFDFAATASLVRGVCTFEFDDGSGMGAWFDVAVEPSIVVEVPSLWLLDDSTTFGTSADGGVGFEPFGPQPAAIEANTRATIRIIRV